MSKRVSMVCNLRLSSLVSLLDTVKWEIYMYMIEKFNARTYDWLYPVNILEYFEKNADARS